MSAAPYLKCVAYSEKIPCVMLTQHWSEKKVELAVAQERAGAGAFAASLAGRVSASGCLSLPAEVRREVGLEKGGSVQIYLTDKASASDLLGWRADGWVAQAKGAKH